LSARLRPFASSAIPATTGTARVQTLSRMHGESRQSVSYCSSAAPKDSVENPNIIKHLPPCRRPYFTD